MCRSTQLLLLLFFLHSRGLLFVLWPRTSIISGLLLPLFSNFFAFNFRAIQLMPEPNVEKRQIEGLLHLGNAYFYRYFFFDLMELRTPKPWCFWGDGLPQKSLLIVLIRRPFSVFFFSSNLEKVRGVPSLLGLQVTTTLKLSLNKKHFSCLKLIVEHLC